MTFVPSPGRAASIVRALDPPSDARFGAVDVDRLDEVQHGQAEERRHDHDQLLEQRESAARPAHTSPSPTLQRWTLKGVLDGSEKIKFRVPNQKLYSAYAGERFDWSTKGAGTSTKIPIAAVPLLLPMPVGPVTLELYGGASAHVGGNALLDLSVEDIVMEATAAELMGIGVAAAALLVPMPVIQIGALISLARTKLKGQANLTATARASVSAGADLFIEGLANAKAWPVVPYASGKLGVEGSIRAEANFGAGADVELGVTGLRAIGFSQSIGTKLSADLALTASAEVGIMVGYRPASFEKALWHHNERLGPKVDIRTGVTGGNNLTLMTNNDGGPTINLDEVAINAKALLDAMFTSRNVANDRIEAPANDNDDPGVSAQGIGRIGSHGSKPSSLRDGHRLLWLESEHVIPFATGKRLWEVVSLAVPGRGGSADRGQTTIMIYYGAARLKTPEDNTVSRSLEAAVSRSDAVRRLRSARAAADAGHPEALRREAPEIVGLLLQGLREAEADAIARTNAAIIEENRSREGGNPRTNGERRSPPGTSEPPLPSSGDVASAASTQYDDIVSLVTEALEKANENPR
jgi:hypothetical protein